MFLHDCNGISLRNFGFSLFLFQEMSSVAQFSWLKCSLILAYFLNIFLYSCKQVQNMVKAWIPLADLPRYSRPRKRRNQSTCSSQNAVFQDAGNSSCRFVCWIEKFSCLAVMFLFFFCCWLIVFRAWWWVGLQPNLHWIYYRNISRFHPREAVVQEKWSESCLKNKKA